MKDTVTILPGLQEVELQDAPPHIQEYFDLVDRVGEWLKRRASHGDKTVEELALIFAENVTKRHGPTAH